MLLIPSGEFRAGADPRMATAECDKYYKKGCQAFWFRHESPVHAVSLDAFHIDKYEVTQADFKRVMGREAPMFTGGNLPIIMVSWNEASDYCARVGKRLPTEMEWEKAARGGRDTLYPWGDSVESGKANFCDRQCQYSHNSEQFDDGFAELAPVGSYPANGYGLFDMAGNAAEWVADWYREDYYKESPRDNPKGPGPAMEKVYRGGGYGSTPDSLRNAYRHRQPAKERMSDVGFRCAATAGPAAKTASAPAQPPASPLTEDILAFGQGKEFQQASQLIAAVTDKLQEIENRDPDPQKTIAKTWKPHLNEIKENLYPKAQEAHRLVNGIALKTSEVKAVRKAFADAAALFESIILDTLLAISSGNAELFQKAQANFEKFAGQWQAAGEEFARLGDVAAAQNEAATKGSAPPPSPEPAPAKAPPEPARISASSPNAKVTRWTSQFNDNSWAARNLTDGRTGPGHEWSSAPNSPPIPQEIVIQLAKPTKISKIEINPSSSDINKSRWTRQVGLYYGNSPGGPWNGLARRELEQKDEFQSFVFSFPFEASYVLVRVESNWGGNYAHMSEIRIVGEAGSNR
ncbi:MAG: SUMF1/EgtB/PvdO family nonheme iron enzyme [Nitrospinae bacterium]|nr:SUMF1/EgtB/PvdO family nonheme iron enzyme [Nitrospinota bacterium]